LTSLLGWTPAFGTWLISGGNRCCPGFQLCSWWRCWCLRRWTAGFRARVSVSRSGWRVPRECPSWLFLAAAPTSVLLERSGPRRARGAAGGKTLSLVFGAANASAGRPLAAVRSADGPFCDSSCGLCRPVPRCGVAPAGSRACRSSGSKVKLHQLPWHP
jgi:hypothetical protein